MQKRKLKKDWPIILIFLALPFLVFLLTNKLYFNYWLMPNLDFHVLKNVQSIEGIAPVTLNTQISHKFTYSRVYTAPNEDKPSPFMLSRYIYSSIDTFPEDNGNNLITKLYAENLKPQNVKLLSAVELDQLTDFFTHSSPYLYKKIGSYPFFFITGDFVKLKDKNDQVLYAYELSSQIENDHYLDEVVFFQNNRVLSASYYYYDIAGLEGIGFFTAAFTVIIELVGLFIYCIYRIYFRENK